jgi:alpha-beta hydrolase superfamily lysophospholipase
MAAGVRDVEKRLRDAGLDVDAIYYPDARHEIFNELQQGAVRADLLAWLDKHIPSRG